MLAVLAFELLFSQLRPSFTAVAEGTAKVTATVGKLSAECVVSVTKKGGNGVSTTQANELPLLKFEVDGDENSITDTEVIAHEQKLGRVAEDVMIGSQGPFPGFLNKDLTIPAVAYGLAIKDGTRVAIAVAKESLDNCPKTTAMLAEYGFTDIQEGSFDDGTPYKAAIKDDNKNIFVRLTNLKRKDGYGATMQIDFVKVPEQKDMKGTAAMFQIFENTKTQSAAQMRRLASEQYEKAQSRMILKQNELQQLRRR